MEMAIKRMYSAIFGTKKENNWMVGQSAAEEADE